MQQLTTPNKISGFSLIELMIVVAIIGILSSIAYPSYIEQINKSKRATAAASILECSSVLERRFTISNSYTTDACDNINNDDYTLTVAVACVANGKNNCFDITATVGANSSDVRCKTLTYSHLGVKGATKSDDTAAENEVCWRTS